MRAVGRRFRASSRACDPTLAGASSGRLLKQSFTSSCTPLRPGPSRSTFSRRSSAAISVHDVRREDQGLATFWGWYGFKWLLLVLVGLSWMWAREIPESKWRGYHWRVACAWDDGLGPFSPFWAHGFWSPLEICLGVGSAFIGAGFYVYPVAITLAGVVRLVHWARGPPQQRSRASTIYVPTKRRTRAVATGPVTTRRDCCSVLGGYQGRLFAFPCRFRGDWPVRGTRGPRP